MKNKVTVVGAGHVGATVAQYVAQEELADVVLVDIVEGLPQGKCLDLMETGPVRGLDSRLIGANDYEAISGSDVIVITAGLARKPGMSREDLLMKNAAIVGGVTEQVAAACPDAVLIVVSNPLDIMAQLCWKKSGFPSERVIGMAGVLDSARFRTFVAMELGVSVKDTQALVLGGHGDAMVPLPRYCTVAGIPITELMPPERIEAIVERTRKAGGEIVGYLKTGSAYYSPGASTVEMVAAVLKDTNRVLPCAVRLQGEYGLTDVYAGVPVILGAGGVKKIIELDLSESERQALHASAAIVRENVEKLDAAAF